MAKQVMSEQRRRTYAEGDRVRVWRKVGEPARLGTVTSVVGGATSVRLDGESGSRRVNWVNTAPYYDPQRRRIVGILLTVGGSLIVVAAVLAWFGLLPLDQIARNVLLAFGLVSLYLVVQGIVFLRYSADPLRPLPTVDPTKDNSPTWVD